MTTKTSSSAEDSISPSFSILHAYGPLRRAAERYLEEHHYMRSSGGSGAMFAVIRDDASVTGACLIGATSSSNQERNLIAGACLIGPAASRDAERSIAQPSVLIRQIKRSHIADDVPVTAVCESRLLRTAMQSVTDEYDAPVLFVSYADPAAVDERSGMPMAGWCYLAAGYFYAGETTSVRWCLIDHLGRARSTRQGAVTLTRKTLPRAGELFHGELVTANWQMRRLPPARIWLAVCTPSRMSRRQARHTWRGVWASLNPTRRVAARRWSSHAEWRRKLAGGTVPLGSPRAHQCREHDRFQPALWRGKELTRTAAPVWVPLVWQSRILYEQDVERETVAGRVYEPFAA